MVENEKFLNRLRNGHLEKSVVTGIFRALRSPKTAKAPAKVHLRLRFQNLGKPRTAGLCGRAAGACDCGPLSCSKSSKSHLKLFSRISSKSYRHNTVPNCFSSRSSISLTNGPRSLSRAKAGTHSASPTGSHTAAHTPKHGLSLPRPQRVFVLSVKFLLFRHAFIYIHFPVLCEPPLSAEREKSGKAAAINFISNRFSSRFLTSRTNSPRSLSRVKAGTHSAFGEKSHTRAYTAERVCPYCLVY